MAWTAVNPVVIGYATKKSHYDNLWGNVDELKDIIEAISIGTVGTTPSADFRVFPVGTKMWFYQDVAPTGWTIDATPADALLAVKGGADAYNVAGGNQAGTWTQPNHTHGVSSHQHAVDPPITITSGSAGEITAGAGAVPVPSTSHNHTVNIVSFLSGWGGPGSTNAGGTANTYRPLAQVGIICTKD